MVEEMGVGEAKRRFSELVSRIVYKGERFVIQRNGKSVVALVPAEDLDAFEAEPQEPRGLMAAVGAWAEFGDEQVDEMVEGLYRQRVQAQDRIVDLEA
jgi:prevent-host-death family protein